MTLLYSFTPWRSTLKSTTYHRSHFPVSPLHPPPTPAQLRSTNRHLAKLQRAEELYTGLVELRARGYLLIFTNGSSEDEPGVGRIAGYGIATESGVQVTSYMPLQLRQTNNAAGVYAAIRALQIVPNTKIAICTNSEYVLLGAQGAAKRWQCQGWRGSSGKVSCVELWQTLLQELSNPDREILWVKVPSHVDVPSNRKQQLLTYTGPSALASRSHRLLASLTLPLSGAIQYVAHHAGRQSATRAARHHPPGGSGGHGSDLTTAAKCSGWRRNTPTSAKTTSKGASRSQNPTQSQGAAGSKAKARSQSPARQSTTGAGSKTVREDPKDKEIRELKDMIQELTATIKELRASIRHPKKTSDNEDAAEPTQLAQRPRTYAEAAAKGKSSSVQKSQESSQSSAYTVVKSRSTVKVLGKPKDVGMPVQPTHGVAAEEARTWQASALLPLQLWKEAENKQLGLLVLNPNKPPSEWKVSERPGTFQRVLML